MLLPKKRIGSPIFMVKNVDDLNLEDDPFKTVQQALESDAILLGEALEGIEKFQKIIDMQAKRLDDQEAMIASLTMAYVEMFAAVDMLIKTTIEDYTPEDQQKFLEQFSEFRANVMKSIEEISRNGTEGLDPDAKRAVEDMA